MSARQVALRLAAIKAVKSHLAKVESDAKAELLDHLDPGDRKGAVLPNGTEVGSAYVTKEGEPALAVVDDRKFLRWVKENRPTAIIEAVRESDRKSILEQALSTGDVPDGVDLVDGKASYVGVRQSDEQRAAVVAAWRSGVLELPTIAGELES